MADSPFPPPSLRCTDDGSHTLYSNRFEQHYHNPGGAVAESRHLFFEQNGLRESLGRRDAIHILEIGLGTGLNLLLLMDYLLDTESTCRICYHTIEAWPIAPQTAGALNYGNYLNHTEPASKLPLLFKNLDRGFNYRRPLPEVDVHLFYGLFADYRPDDVAFDFIFHDAFSPRVNPELWTGTVFSSIHRWSTGRAVLSTYCAASAARGAMAWAGWNVARAPGALGKREMTLASPAEAPLLPFKRVNEERLARRYEAGDF